MPTETYLPPEHTPNREESERLSIDSNDYTFSAIQRGSTAKIGNLSGGVKRRNVEAFPPVKIYVSSYLGSILEKSLRQFKAVPPLADSFPRRRILPSFNLSTDGPQGRTGRR